MLEFVTKMAVSFSPLSKSSTSARSFIQMCLTDKRREATKAQIEISPSDLVTRPSVLIVFNDKKELRFEDCSGVKATEMINDLKRYNKKLQLLKDIQASI